MSIANSPIPPYTFLVPDKRSRDLEVVVVRRIVNLGTGKLGVGRKWERVEEREVSLRVT
jgi:hypothetical protein